jgi:outer membrane protein assembly factor BamB
MELLMTLRHQLNLVGLALATLALASCGQGYRMDPDDLSAEGNWSCSRGSTAHTGAIETSDFDGRLYQCWQKGVGGKPAGPLAVHNGTLVYPETKKKIRFYDIETGDYLGRIKPKGVPQSGVVVADSLAFVALAPKSHYLKAFNLITGKNLWRRDVKDALPGPIITDNRLIISSSVGVLSAYGLDDGELVWSFVADGRLTASATLAGDILIQPGDRGALYALSVVDGELLYRVRLEGAVATPAVAGDLIYVAGVNGTLTALDPDDGRVVWSTDLGGPVWTSPALVSGRLFVGHSAGEIMALDAASGEIVWRRDVSEVVKASVLAIGDYIVAGTMTGKLVVLDADEGTLTDSVTVEGAIAFPPVTDGRRLFIATQAGKIICFGEQNEQADLAHNRIESEHQP